MNGRAALALLMLLLASWLAAFAGEGDPWMGEPPHLRFRMEEMADAEARGDVGPAEREELRRYWANHLRRGPMNALESAQYSIAELQLQRGNPTEALAELNKVLANTQSVEVRHLSHLNLAVIYRLRLNDSAKAVEHYRQVGGPLRHRAQQAMLAMLEEKGKPAEAAKQLEKLIAEAKEKGEKLALLHRLAALYKRAYMADQALATYQRITKEFTPDGIQAMHEAIVAEVKATFDRLMALMQEGRGNEVEGFERQLHGRAEELRMAGRWGEARAFREAMHKGFQRLREFHENREREERERRGREERGRPREGERRDDREL